MKQINQVIVAACAVIALVLPLVCSGGPASAAPPPFYLFPYRSVYADRENRELTQDDVRNLARLGYGGIELGSEVYNEAKLKTMLGWLDEAGLKPCTIYTMAQVKPDGSVQIRMLPDNILKLLAGRGTVLWVASWANFQAPKTGLDQAKTEAAFVAAVTQYADKVAPHGLQIALYNHWGHWLEKVSEGCRLARQINHPNVGVTFNLFHHLGGEGPATVEATIREAAPLLRTVSINGAKADTHKLSDAVLTLDQGDYDLRGLLRLLTEVGYRGPIGTHGVAKMPAAEQLERASRGWKTITEPIKP